MAEDYYSTLGIRPDASREEIETAYRISLEKLSSDQALNKQQLQKKIARLNEAYAVLSDEEKRRKYDQLGGEGFSKRYSLDDIIRGVNPEKILKRLGLENSPLKSLFHNHSSADKPFSFSDLFSKSFDPDFSPETEPISHPNGDSEIDLVLTLEEAVFGGKKRVILRWGTAKYPFFVIIPPGIKEGQQLRVQGKGDVELETMTRGDLYCNIKIMPHPVFWRENDDLHIKAEVPLTTLILGGTVTINTLDEKKLEVSIPALSNEDSVVCIKGKGVRSADRKPGDLKVLLIARLPTSLSKEQEQLFRDLSRLGL